ncbi:MAG TPA: FAD:protein FMN transferase [Clostridia bacterium]|nr:FAD:protein FMN transferase [Clostridia bacterium]
MISAFHKKKSAEKTFFALGTVNAVKIYGSKDVSAVDAAIARIREIEDRMSAFLPDSDLAVLRKNAGRGPTEIHRDTFRVLQKAASFGALTDGAFDVTVRPLTELWGINKKDSFIPSEEELRKARSLVNYRDLQLDQNLWSASLARRGQALDLGSIAKGFAADEAGQVLLGRGIECAVINLGGNVLTLGKRPDGAPWRIGVQNPLAPSGQPIGVLSVDGGTSVVTSGSNERFFIRDGKRYHHLLNPRTGEPAQNSMLSVTVLCPCSADADAATTALFLLGPEKAKSILRKIRAEAVIIGRDLSVTVSDGLLNRFQPIYETVKR